MVGGATAVVGALLDALGPDGTLMAYAGWEESPYHLDAWPVEWQRAYEAELPPFDPTLSEAHRAYGWLPERIRTWPGARRSRHPEANVVALGPRAAWITADHPWDDAYGPGSPLARLVEADGQVLMLGAPLDTLTLLHHAEATTGAPAKRRVVYRMPVLEEGRAVWRTFHDIDTGSGAFPYGDVQADIDGTEGMQSGEGAFAAIARSALAAGISRGGRVAHAESFVFPARELHGFAVAWLERRFG